ncbi:acyl-CoA/acyl-ACP dehydrogenase [bacterium]|nr:acyl-CoA/acyl-ACP dehydrogenase [bacterium]
MTQPENFGYGVEEQLLQAEARKFFKKHCNELTLMDLLARNPDPERKPECQWDRKTWQKMTELGWNTMAVPESAGGLGMRAVAVATLVEEAGRAALPSPLMATVNATYVLAACGTEGAAAALGEIAADKTASLAITNAKGSWEISATDVAVSFTDGGMALNGASWFVQDAGKADFLVVKAASQAGIGLFVVPVDAPGVTIIPDAIVDLSRDQAHVTFENVAVGPANVAAEPGRGRAALEKARPALLTMVSADMCGAGEWQLQTTAAYARERKQFDRPIGFFQAVKHPIVNMMIMIDSARSHVYNAACAIDHEPEEADRYATMAKAAASDMAAFCSSRSVQYHGGMGFTWECFIHLYFKRQKHNQVLYGDAVYHRARLADMLIGPVAA